jgi:ankyrin repeat protein
MPFHKPPGGERSDAARKKPDYARGNSGRSNIGEQLLMEEQVHDEGNEKYMELGLAFLRAGKTCDPVSIQQLLDQDAPVNLVDPVDHATALHYIAAYDARPALRVLLKSGKCDFLIRDRNGRLPSELAREFGRDDAMARLLLIKEVRQAQAQGIDPGSLYKLSARQPCP